MDVEAVLQRWLDEEAIRRSSRASPLLDLGDWPGYRSCFTDKLLIDFTRLTGQPKIFVVDADDWTRFADLILSPCAASSRLFQFRYRCHRRYRPAVWYFTARHWKPTDMGASHNQHGWYNSSYVREGGVWKMSYVKHDFQWVDGNNALFDMTEPNLVACMHKVFRPENASAAAGK